MINTVNSSVTQEPNKIYLREQRTKQVFSHPFVKCLCARVSLLGQLNVNLHACAPLSITLTKHANIHR